MSVGNIQILYSALGTRHAQWTALDLSSSAQLWLVMFAVMLWKGLVEFD